MYDFILNQIKSTGVSAELEEEICFEFLLYVSSVGFNHGQSWIVS